MDLTFFTGYDPLELGLKSWLDPPFGQGEEEEGALVHIVVTHMLSDGSRIGFVMDES